MKFNEQTWKNKKFIDKFKNMKIGFSEIKNQGLFGAEDETTHQKSQQIQNITWRTISLWRKTIAGVPGNVRT